MENKKCKKEDLKRLFNQKGYIGATADNIIVSKYRVQSSQEIKLNEPETKECSISKCEI